MFRDAVAAFAEEEVRPRVSEMEKAGKIDPALITKYFEMGLMGIEVPEEYGGAGGSLFMVTLAVEEISKVDASAAIVCDVQNTLVNYPIVDVRNRGAEVDVPPAAHARDGRRVRALRGRLGLRRVRPGDARREARRPLDSERPEAVDHQRRRSRRSSSCSRTRIRRPATRASRRSSSSATSRASPSARRKTSSAFARRARPS